MDDDLRQYRAHLVDTLRFLNEAYDKMLLTLAGGALGLSLVFLSDVVTLPNVETKYALIVGWIAFVASLACVLGRILFGIEANRKAISQVDDGTIYEYRPGTVFATISRTLHIGSALLLVVGLLSMAVFMHSNVGGDNVETGTEETATAEAFQGAAPPAAEAEYGHAGETQASLGSSAASPSEAGSVVEPPLTKRSRRRSQGSRASAMR